MSTHQLCMFLAVTILFTNFIVTVQTARLSEIPGDQMPNTSEATTDVTLSETTLEPATGSTSTLSPLDKALCKNPKIDAIFGKNDRGVYIFQGDIYYWRKDLVVEETGYTEKISTGWPGLPDNIDAAYRFSNNKTYFFKGHQYWRFTDHQMDESYPKNISEKFRGVPNDLDAVIWWHKKGKIFFFKDKEFTTYDTITKKYTYHNKMHTLNLPSNIDAGYQVANGVTLIFKGSSYYIFYETFPTEIPKSSKYWLFCK